nr:MAG TPA: hypothetical protein [Caudoviricetes sp.]
MLSINPFISQIRKEKYRTIKINSGSSCFF